jgi:hypothetical protein
MMQSCIILLYFVMFRFSDSSIFLRFESWFQSTTPLRFRVELPGEARELGWEETPCPENAGHFTKICKVNPSKA